MSTWRRDNITRFIYGWAKGVLPTLSATEREAIEAGDVWWDADIFTGNPDWSKLLAVPGKTIRRRAGLSGGPVEELCRLVDEWHVSWDLHDLPPDIWEFLKAKKFFAMIIPKEYGGLGFSAYAHSEVVRKLSTRSVTAAVTAMVPNSLGPGELLLQFGTKEQRDYWLPRLADGREIPCFGLTSPEAGSDAASMIDTGIVDAGNFRGRDVLGIRLNWHKRYITLGPIATVLGLAFKLHDPDHLSARRMTSASRSRWCPPTCPASRSAAGICRPCRCSRTAPTGDTTYSFRSTHHRRGRAGRQRLEDVDERARRRARHLAAVAFGRGRRLRRAHDRRLCAHPRAVSSSDRKIRGDPGAARPHGRHRLPARRGAPHDLRRHRSGPSPGGRHGDHERAGDGAAARVGQRCHGRARRKGRASKGRRIISAASIARCRSASQSRAPTSSPAA